MPKQQKGAKVGIFWVYRGRLLMAAFQVADGLRYGDAIHSQVDHVEFWPDLQRRIKALQDLEYEHVPRGRVVFLDSEDRFCVIMDKKLHTPRTKELLMKAFSLPRARTAFLTDPHYTTDAKELRRLFED